MRPGWAFYEGIRVELSASKPTIRSERHSGHQEPTATMSLTNWYDLVWKNSREEEPYEKQMAGCQPSLYCFPAERGAAQRPSLVFRRIRLQQTHQVHR